MIRYPNGYIIETDPPENAFFVYGELNATGYVVKGFRLDVPNLSNAGWPQKNELYTHLQSYLSRFDASKRLQFPLHQGLELPEDSGEIRIRYGAFG